jgi:hypothetical protein
MKIWRWIAAGLVLAIGACQQPGQSGTNSAPVETYALPAQTALSLRRFSLDTEDYVHVQTGLRFPAKAGAMVRSTITEYLLARDDVSVDYVLPGPGRQKVLVSAYVFPVRHGQSIAVSAVPIACADAYDYARGEMRDHAVNPRLVREAAISEGRFSDAGLHMAAVYDADDMLQQPVGPVRTALFFHCAVDKSWIVMYRVTRSSGYDVDADVEEVMRLMPVKPAS